MLTCCLSLSCAQAREAGKLLEDKKQLETKLRDIQVRMEHHFMPIVAHCKAGYGLLLHMCMLRLHMYILGCSCVQLP